jgi:predicted ATPase with chaperone activity
MLIRTFASAVTGIDAATVTIEVNVSRGIRLIWLLPFKGLILPSENAREAAVVSGLDVYGMEKIEDVVDFFNGPRRPEPVKVDLDEIFRNEANKYDVDFSDVIGQENMKRALEVAAAGFHNLIMLYIIYFKHFAC